jgi:hypothetical protein
MGLSLPTNIEQDDLLLGALEAAMIGDRAYFCEGNMMSSEEDIWVWLDNAYYFACFFLIYGYFEELGELAEKPGKTESKINKLKTRNYQIPGKRTSTVELTLNGISEKQKDYFESTLFSGQEISIVLVKNELLIPDVNGNGRDFDFDTSIVVFSGLRWTVDWNAEADGLWSVVLSTEISGATQDKIEAIRLLRYEPDKSGNPPWEKEE